MPVELVETTRDWAESGVMALTGRPDGPPKLPPGNAASTARACSRFVEEATAGTGNPVVVDGAALLAERAAFTGRTRNGTVSVGGSARFCPTRDGWAVISHARPDDLLLLGALVGEELSNDNVWPRVTRWLASQSDEQITARITLLGIAGGVVTEPAPSAPLIPSASQHFRPVEGTLVVDFSALWAGPLCANLLGMAGARIVKVETPQRPDGARRGNRDFYDLLHGGHESVVLDPSSAEERAALAALVSRADIVIEASRPRALRGFGLDAEKFVRAGACWMSITANGRASDRIGFGDDIAASNGLIAHDEDGTPMFVGDAIADPLAGLAAAATILASSPAHGHLFDMSMARVVASTLAAVDTPSEIARVLPPRRREPTGNSPASGDTTITTLSSLGIELR